MKMLMFAALFATSSVFGQDLPELPAFEQLRLVGSTDNREVVAALKRLYAGRALIVGDFRSPADALALADGIDAAGGRIDQILNDRALVGFIPAGLDESIRRAPGVRFFSRGPVDAAMVPYSDDEGVAGAIHHFNRTLDGSVVRDLLSEIGSMPPMNDAVLPPESAGAPIQTNDVRVQDTIRNPSMTGRIGITFHFVESNGAIDANEFTWTPADRGTIISRSQDGYDWWESQANARGKSILYSIRFFSTPGNAQEYQPYEPIRHPVNHQSHLWVNPIMANFGYTMTSPNPETQALLRVDAYNEALRTAISGQAAFSVFVIYNPSPAPTTHTDGFYTITYFGGPWMDHPFRPGGYPTSSWGWVLAHEMAHVFWACDEYASGCSACSFCFPGLGPRSTTPNGNCDNPCNTNPTACIMRIVNPSQPVCSYTATQIGW
jgi:hypothetical protein